jgi:hypothetical protein
MERSQPFNPSSCKASLHPWYQSPRQRQPSPKLNTNYEKLKNAKQEQGNIARGGSHSGREVRGKEHRAYGSGHARGEERARFAFERSNPTLAATHPRAHLQARIRLAPLRIAIPETCPDRCSGPGAPPSRRLPCEIQVEPRGRTQVSPPQPRTRTHASLPLRACMRGLRDGWAQDARRLHLSHLRVPHP